MNRTVKRITLTFFILCSSLLADDRIEVGDRFAIDDLLSRYSHSWDSKDPEKWADLFIDEGIWQNSFAGKVETILKSNKERLQFAKKLQESFRQKGVTTRHHQTNTLLRKKKDGYIHGETVFSVIWQYADDPLPKLKHSGVYRDQYEKTDKGWRFKFREVCFDHKLFEDTENARLVPDLTLLKPRTLAEHRKLGGRAPYFSHYRKGDIELVFIAARHEPRVGSPTHKLIEEVVEGFDPECVITEGLRSEDGYSPERLIADAKRREKSGNLPEPLYAALLCSEREIPFIGGEPVPVVTTEALRAVTKDDTDILGFLVVRHLGQVRREQPEAELDDKVKRLLPRMIQQFELETALTVDQFKDWYHKTTGRNFSAENLRRGDIAPIAIENPNLLKRMGIAAMMAREKHLISFQSKMLLEHRRVLVVYGSGHLVYESEVLEDMLGKPIQKGASW